MVTRLRQSGMAERAGLYGLLFGGLLLVFILIRFPVGRLTPMIADEVARSGAPVRLDFGAAGLAFPVGLSFDDILIFPAGDSGPALLTIDNLTLKPAWLSLLTFSGGAKAYADLLEGSLFMQVSADSFSEGGRVAVDLEMDEIEPGRAKSLLRFPLAALSGALSGRGEVSFDPAAWVRGAGELEVEWREGSFTLSPAITRLGPVLIDQGTAHLTMAEGKVKVERLALVGPEIDLQTSGTVTLAPVVKYSRLNLTVRLTLKGALKKKLDPLLFMLPPAHGGVRTIKLGGSLMAPSLMP